MGQMTPAKKSDGLFESSLEITWAEQGAARQLDSWNKMQSHRVQGCQNFLQRTCLHWVRGLPCVPPADPGDMICALKPLRYPSGVQAQNP